MPDSLNKIISVVQSDNNRMDLVLSKVRSFVTEGYKKTLSVDSQCKALPVNDTKSEHLRMFRISKLVFGEEDIYTRLVSLFQTVHDLVDACYLMIRGSADGKTELYLGIRAETNTVMAFETMQGNFKGNFPGTTIESLDANSIKSILTQINPPYYVRSRRPSVALVSMVPSRRNMVDAAEDSLKVQGMDKFVDSMPPQEYIAVIVAVPLGSKSVMDRRNALESLATAISPLMKITFQYGENMTVSKQASINRSIADSVNQSVTDAYNTSTTNNRGISRGGTAHWNSHFNSFGFGFGSQSGNFNSTAYTNGVTNSNTYGTGKTVTSGESSTEELSMGMSESWSLEHNNQAIQSLLKEVEKQLTRIDQCDVYGAWDACAYFVSQEPRTVRIAAANYQSLICGENSSGSVNVWLPALTGEEEKNHSEILKYAAAMKIPIFKRSNYTCQAGTMISGSEMPILMNLPRRSVRGMPIVDMAAFGREAFAVRGNDPAVHNNEKSSLLIGKVYHMGNVEENNTISLDPELFSSHALFCGTTGVGKSTLVAMILNALTTVHKHFMLVEPVKGEYKQLLGGIKGIQVFTTDPLVCRLLRINPFEFIEGIQVLSHIDRLIDIFSVCWPLYAAQPAVLRECIEEAYVACGWDLSNSEYMKPGFKRYPTFSMLLDILPQVIARSHFVGESKGTYEGALLARLGMLTRGIYGQILNGASNVTDEELFDHNVIVDLSMAGSQETISLIMGLLIIRLREYRTVTGRADNAPLSHVMVLEEAHNIFPREKQQNVEGGENVAGKAVKMLVQCIAEMRSYGQGFFIADQSPSAIDIAGIRNTATKIAMQLPEKDDQDIIAKALSLTDKQAKEMARLPRQVAVVYQNSWLEPVLLKITDKKDSSVINAYKSKVDIASPEDIRTMRGKLAAKILPMAKSGILEPEKLLSTPEKLAVPTALNPSKQKDYAAICRHYIKWYQQEGPFSAEEDEEERIHFFAAFLTTLLSCDLLLRILPPPAIPKNIDSRNQAAVIRAKASKWHKDALRLVECYASGLTETEKDGLIQVLLTDDGKSDSATLLKYLYP